MSTVAPPAAGSRSWATARRSGASPEIGAALLMRLEAYRAADGGYSVAPDAELMESVCSCINTLLPTLKPEYARAIQRVDRRAIAAQRAR